MPTQFTDNLFSRTYKDDFADSANYHRVLFNSGRALQARELTQLQTIIQKEMEVFGRNIFKEGANVAPAGITINNRYEFIKLDTSNNTLPVDTSNFIGAEFEGNDSGIKVKCLEVITATATDPATLYVTYTDTTGGTPGDDPVRMTAGEDIIANSIGITLTVQSVNTTANPAIGVGTKVSIDQGHFFTQGHFVYAPKQSQIIGKYTETPTTIIGFKVQQDVVSADDTEALFDNQGATPNRSAPGADRYRIKLILTEQDLVDSDENFVYFCRIINGNVFDVVQGNNQYAKIEDRMALRTNEIHGNFLVEPFFIHHEDDSDATFLQTVVSPGTAYVKGYRAHRDYTTRLRVPRAQDTITLNNDVAATDYGNYVIVNNVVGLPDINVFQKENLYDSIGAQGVIIGTARVRHIEEDAANLRYYLFDIKMDSAETIEDVKSIGSGPADKADIIFVQDAVLQEPRNNDLLFPLTHKRPKVMSDISLEVQRQFLATLDGAGAATLTLTASGETFANTNEWIIIDNVTGIIESNITITGAGTQVVSLSGGTPSAAIRIVGKVNKASGSIRNKTLEEHTVSVSIQTDSNGTKFIPLGKPDLYKLDRLRDSDSDGENLMSSFIIDNGQRDNWYSPAKAILKSSAREPNNNVFARFRYFTHGASGDFFAAQSYTGQVDYGSIPSHTTKSGEKIELRDVLDFRPRIDDTDSDFQAGNARINELPDDTDLITADIEYYLPRYDRVTVDIDGLVRVKQGRSSLDPKFPPVSPNEMVLANITMEAFTISDSDIGTQPLETKLYQMQDVGEISSKLETLTEITTLSLLETNLSNLDVLDASGNDRTKAGFLVDNFSDQLASSFDNPEYRASIDPQNKILRPAFNQEAVRLKYDSDLSTNTILKGDNVYTKYSEVEYITQLQVSETMNINPFNVITNLGTLTLSPASDEWRETQFTAARTVSGGTTTNFSGSQNQLFNNAQWNWAGTQVGDTRSRALSSSSSSSTGTSVVGTGSAGNWRAANIQTTRTTSVTTTSAVARVASFSTIRRVVGDRVVDVALIPFMRSRRISFKAEGLKPNTRLWPFFDGVDVSQWVRQTSFARIAQSNQEVGNRFNNRSSIPEGAEALFTNAEGSVEGEFLIPNSPSQRFRTGSREFKLLDISSNNEDNATSIAVTPFVSAGTLETRQRTIQTTRVRNVVTGTSTSTSTTSQNLGRNMHLWNVATGERRINGQVVVPPRTVRQRDPLAQSFFIPDQDGVFLTSIDIFFETKDDVIPVEMQLRPMVNGHPSSEDIIPGSVVFKSPTAITASPTPVATNFEFEEPVYLLPYQEYAVVLIAETNAYNVYVAKAGDFILNSTEQRITSQPSLGSLFKSQNTSTWTPDQERDLMFRLNRADFNNTVTTEAVLRNTEVPLYLLGENPIETRNNSNRLIFNAPDHGLNQNDRVRIYGLDSNASYATLRASSIMGERFVQDVDNDFFEVQADSTSQPGSRQSFGGFEVEVNRQIQFEEIWPNIDFNLPQSTSVAVSGKFASGKSIAGTEALYDIDASSIPLSVKERNVLNAPRVIMTAKQEQLNLPVGTKSATLTVDMQADTSYISPVIDMQRSSIWLTHNRIDNPFGVAGPNFNVPLNFVEETDKTSGTILSKHITRPVTLAEAAVGLKVILAANRPAAANFKLFYKVANDDQLFEDLNWEEVFREEELPTDENPAIFRDYEYVVGGASGLADPFTRFIFKLTMTSYNNAKPPSFKDLRVIALAV